MNAPRQILLAIAGALAGCATAPPAIVERGIDHPVIVLLAPGGRCDLTAERGAFWQDMGRTAERTYETYRLTGRGRISVRDANGREIFVWTDVSEPAEVRIEGERVLLDR